MQLAGMNERIAGMGTPLVDRLLPSTADKDLLDDLQQITGTKAPKDVLVQTLGSRSNTDRREISRILGQIPMIRDARASRTQPAGCADVLSLSAKPLSPAEPPQGAKPRSVASTPRNIATPRGLLAAGAAVAATPRSARTPRTPQAVAAGTLGGAATISEIRVDGEVPPDLNSAMSEAVDAKSDDKIPEAEKQAVEIASQRVAERLAEIGADAHEMAPGDLLRMYYSRGSGSTYWHMTREAERRLNAKPVTPRSFQEVLSERAHREVRQARDMPSTHVNECLDKWEVDSLADLCRGVKHFVEAAKGPRSIYRTSYVAHR
jgi:hypothetical protein